MKIDHPAFVSPILELVGTYEFDLQFGEDGYPTRIELFRATDVPNHYRARLWQIEHFRIQATFPAEEGQPLDDPGDEEFLTERSHYQKQALAGFHATSTEDAIQQVIEGLVEFLGQAVGRDEE